MPRKHREGFEKNFSQEVEEFLRSRFLEDRAEKQRTGRRQLSVGDTAQRRRSLLDRRYKSPKKTKREGKE
jgi:hypothetical protein